MNSEHQRKVLIVDDEMQSRLLIRKLLESHDTSFNIAEADSVAAALEVMKSVQPDLIFLDVQMRGETGFDLLDRIAELQLPVIFITAHSDYAVRAFRYHALDYLLKPIDPTEFDQAFQRVMQTLNGKQSSERYTNLRKHIQSTHTIPEKIAVPTMEGYLFLYTQEILYCRAAGNYTELVMTGLQKVLSSHNLGYFEELVSGHHFFRVHRSYLVNLRHIRKYLRGDGGTIVMQDGMEIEVSRSNKDAFLKLFKE